MYTVDYGNLPNLSYNNSNAAQNDVPVRSPKLLVRRKVENQLGSECYVFTKYDFKMNE